MRKPKVVRGKELPWEPGRDDDSSLLIRHGITSKTVDNPALKMGRTVVPAGGGNASHYHANCDVGVYMLKGSLTWFLGAGDNEEEVLIEEGDFVFIPAGTMHGLINRSHTESAEFLSVKNAGDAKAEGTIVAGKRKEAIFKKNEGAPSPPNDPRTSLDSRDGTC